MHSYPHLCTTHYAIVHPTNLRRLSTTTDITTGASLPSDTGISHTMTRRTMILATRAGCRLCRSCLLSLRWGSSVPGIELGWDDAKYFEYALDGVDEEDMDAEIRLRLMYVAKGGAEWWDIHKVLILKEDESGFPPQTLVEMEVAADDGKPNVTGLPA